MTDLFEKGASDFGQNVWTECLDLQLSPSIYARMMHRPFHICDQFS